MWERGTKCTLTRLHGCFLWWGENTVLFFLPDYVDSGHLENLVSGGSAPFGGETRRTFTKQTQCHLAAGVGESGGGLPASHAGAETNQDTLRHLWPKWHALWQLNITRGFINQEKSHKSIKIHQRLVKEDFFIIGFIWPLFHWEVTLRLKSFFFFFYKWDWAKTRSEKQPHDNSNKSKYNKTHVRLQCKNKAALLPQARPVFCIYMNRLGFKGAQCRFSRGTSNLELYYL